MRWFVRILAHLVLYLTDSRADPLEGTQGKDLEIALLRMQVRALQRTHLKPRMDHWFRAAWVLASTWWPCWRKACLVIQPETVIRWHRLGFKLFWRWKSRRRGEPGRPAVSMETRALIRTMAMENTFWGAPRIHGELVKLGIPISERSVQRWIPKRPSDPKKQQSWRQFLANHAQDIAAMDFCVVPTVTFGLLYVLVIIEHGRRVVRHFNVTNHPTAEWVKQQLREAFPFEQIPKYLLMDRDTTFGAVKGFVESMGISPKVTAYRCPWQNGVCERMIGTLRRDLLDHVIVLNEAHLRRLLKNYLAYYHEDRTHLGLNKDSPQSRPVEPRGSPRAKLAAIPRVGGLHHRYTWTDAA